MFARYTHELHYQTASYVTIQEGIKYHPDAYVVPGSANGLTLGGTYVISPRLLIEFQSAFFRNVGGRFDFVSGQRFAKQYSGWLERHAAISSSEPDRSAAGQSLQWLHHGGASPRKKGEYLREGMQPPILSCNANGTTLSSASMTFTASSALMTTGSPTSALLALTGRLRAMLWPTFSSAKRITLTSGRRHRSFRRPRQVRTWQTRLVPGPGPHRPSGFAFVGCSLGSRSRCR